VKAWKVILAAGLLFAAGAATGAAGARIRTRTALRAELARRSPLPGIAWQRYEFLRRAQRDLKLTEEQKTRIDGQVQASQERFRQLWEPIAPQARAEFETLREQIRRELTAEQQARFDQLLKKSEKERRRPREGTGTNESAEKRAPRSEGK
jgi:hypothetical protein